MGEKLHGLLSIGNDWGRSRTVKIMIDFEAGGKTRQKFHKLSIVNEESGVLIQTA
jgi:hypothetical protein